jgi:hypothetical protein
MYKETFNLSSRKRENRLFDYRRAPACDVRLLKLFNLVSSNIAAQTGRLARVQKKISDSVLQWRPLHSFDYRRPLACGVGLLKLFNLVSSNIAAQAGRLARVQYIFIRRKSVILCFSGDPFILTTTNLCYNLPIPDQTLHLHTFCRN